MADDALKKKGNILIVDDDSAVRDFLGLFLEKKGYAQVKRVGSGEEAVEIAGKEPVDIIFLDVKLPGIDGIEVLKRIKKINKAISVIMITGYPDEEKAKEAIKEGAYDYIIKPFDLFYLELTLNTKLIQLEE